MFWSTPSARAATRAGMLSAAASPPARQAIGRHSWCSGPGASGSVGANSGAAIARSGVVIPRRMSRRCKRALARASLLFTVPTGTPRRRAASSWLAPSRSQVARRPEIARVAGPIRRRRSIAARRARRLTSFARQRRPRAAHIPIVPGPATGEPRDLAREATPGRDAKQPFPERPLDPNRVLARSTRTRKVA